jgi:hypothetical protein
MAASTLVVWTRVPAWNQFRGLWDARIYARRVGNPFARRHNFSRKVATIRRYFCNEQGVAVKQKEKAPGLAGD